MNMNTLSMPKKNPKSKYYDYFIWSDTGTEYPDARIIFKGLCDSNWQYVPELNKYYLHRFYESQPDWNYRNPQVLLYITQIMIHWKNQGIDGFRLDAIPYLWKEHDTNCESLAKCHNIIKFMRAVMDHIEPGTLFLAEACQPIDEICRYFGEDDECHTAYHFPVMNQIFISLATKTQQPLANIFDQTPKIPHNCSWVMFLRCHDELTLEMVTEEERQLLNNHYCKEEAWSFRQGEGISARLYDLLDENPQKVILAYSILLTLPGIPIIYYGDEVAKQNSVPFFEEMLALTGYKDTRYFCRGRMDWNKIESQLQQEQSPAYQVFHGLKHLLTTRNKNKDIAKGQITFIDCKAPLMIYETQQQQSCRIIHNLSNKNITIEQPGVDLLTNNHNSTKVVPSYGSCWIIKE